MKYVVLLNSVLVLKVAVRLEKIILDVTVRSPEVVVFPPRKPSSAIRVLAADDPIILLCLTTEVFPVTAIEELAVTTSVVNALSASLVLVTNVANVSVDILTFDITLDNS